MQSLILHILLMVLLIAIAWQDYKYRGVSWFIFPLLLSIAVFDLWICNKLAFFLPLLGINISFILMLLFSVTVYFSIKNRKAVNIADTYLGWGDILFFVLLGVMLSPLNFMLFLVTSLLLILILVSVYRKIAQNIPLAGIQASLLFMVLLAREFGFDIDLLDDYWFIQMLSTWN
jgi:hypothetical protein